MKRYISAVIIFAMLLGILLSAVPVSATPVGTAIRNASEFAAMSESGSYYLAADITLASAYAKDFKGVLDGNGHTVKLSGRSPMFTKIVGGEVRDLCISASVSFDTSLSYGALASVASGSFENITTDVHITFTEKVGDFKGRVGTMIGEINGETEILACRSGGSVSINTPSGSSGSFAGGLVGLVNGAGTVKISGCKGYADVTDLQYRMNNGGLIGGITGNSRATVENCVNYATVKGTSGDHSGSGGLIGVVNGTHQPGATFDAIGCVNFGSVIDMSSEAGKAVSNHHIGGIVGRSYASARATFKQCVNAGEISSLGGGWASAGGIVGGLMTYGFSWSGAHGGNSTFNACSNLGRISGAAFSGGIIGGALQHNTNDSKLTVKNCANYGQISAASYAGGIIGECGESAFNGLTVSYCYNRGDVSSVSGRSAGVIGYIDVKQGGSENTITSYLSMTIENCFNEGRISNSSCASGILGTVGSGALTLRYCTNTGELDAPKRCEIALKGKGTVAATSNYTPNLSGGQDYVTTASSAQLSARLTAAKNNAPADAYELAMLILYSDAHGENDTESGYGEFREAHEKALSMLCSSPTAAEASASYASLCEAIENMSLKNEPSTEKVDRAISEAEKHAGKETVYTEATWSRYTEARRRAELLRVAKAETERLDFAAELLDIAISELAELGDMLALQLLLDKCMEYVKEEYTRESWAVFGNAIDEAYSLIELDTASKQGIERVTAAIESARDLLVRVARPDELLERVMQIKTEHPADLYTPSSYEALAIAIKAADRLIADQNFSEDELAACEKALDDAILLLVRRADLGEIDALLATVSGFSADNFEKDGWDRLVAIAKEIETLRGRLTAEGEITDEDIEGYAEALSEAIASLKRIELPEESEAEDSTTPTEDSSTEESGTAALTTEQSGAAGGCGASVSLGASVLLAIFGIAALRGTRERGGTRGDAETRGRDFLFFS